VQHSIRHGDDITGASTFLIEEGLDSGPVYGVVTETIRAQDTSGDLLARLAVSGAGLLVATLDGIETGELVARPQSADGVSLAPKVTVADARIDWTAPALAIDRLIRSCTPAPGAWTELAGERVKVFPVGPVADVVAEPGEVVRVAKNSWAVGTAGAPLTLVDVQPPGKKRMAASDWLRGLRSTDIRFE